MATLPDEITVANVAADSTTVFGIASRGTNKTSYEAPSDQSDLKGQPTKTVGSRTTSNGVEIGNIVTEYPQYDAAAAEYDDAIKLSLNVFRKETHDLTAVQDALEKEGAFLTANALSIAKGLQ